MKTEGLFRGANYLCYFKRARKKTSSCLFPAAEIVLINSFGGMWRKERLMSGLKDDLDFFVFRLFSFY